MVQRYGINENDWMLEKQDLGGLVTYEDWLAVRSLLKNLEAAANAYYDMADLSVAIRGADPNCTYEMALLAARNEARAFLKETANADEQKSLPPKE